MNEFEMRFAELMKTCDRMDRMLKEQGNTIRTLTANNEILVRGGKLMKEHNEKLISQVSDLQYTLKESLNLLEVYRKSYTQYNYPEIAKAEAQYKNRMEKANEKETKTR